MTKREARLLDQLNRRSCYLEFAANREQQEELTALIAGLDAEVQSLPCKSLGRGYSSAMSSLIEAYSSAHGDVRNLHDLFWWGKESGVLSDREAGMMLLSKSRDCDLEDAKEE